MDSRRHVCRAGACAGASESPINKPRLELPKMVSDSETTASDDRPRSIAIITPSFRNDFALAQELCRSIDEFFRGDYEHVLIVPRRDLRMFSTLQSARRRVVVQQSLLKPFGFTQIPVPTRFRIPPVIDVRFPQQWWCKGVGRISGWITQQLIKLSASQVTEAELLLFIDSDVVLFRPLSIDRLLTGGRINLHRGPMRNDMGEHQAWYRSARELLRVEHTDPPRHNYVGQLIAWNRRNLIKLHQHIAGSTGEPWQRVLARKGAFAEYMLYGIYCDEVLGANCAHVLQPSDLTHSVWTDATELETDALIRGLRECHVALHIQSTLSLPIHRRRELLRSVTERQGIRESHAPAYMGDAV
jgi:hypothetical protein